MLKVIQLSVGELCANCFLVIDSMLNTVIIDPGAEAGRILAKIREKNLRPLAILLTHAHFDHFGAAKEVMDETHVHIYVHELDEPFLLSAERSMANSLGYASAYRQVDQKEIRNFVEGEQLEFSPELTFTVLHTPGHTPGSCCFRHDDQLFTGDTLFQNGVGRVDFPGGSVHAMRESLARLGALDGDCEVYCGHYGNTTLEHERQFGHYLIPRKL